MFSKPDYQNFYLATEMSGTCWSARKLRWTSLLKFPSVEPERNFSWSCPSTVSFFTTTDNISRVTLPFIAELTLLFYFERAVRYYTVVPKNFTGQMWKVKSWTLNGIPLISKYCLKIQCLERWEGCLNQKVTEKAKMFTEVCISARATAQYHTTCKDDDCIFQVIALIEC